MIFCVQFKHPKLLKKVFKLSSQSDHRCRTKKRKCAASIDTSRYVNGSWHVEAVLVKANLPPLAKQKMQRVEWHLVTRPQPFTPRSFKKELVFSRYPIWYHQKKQNQKIATLHLQKVPVRFFVTWSYRISCTRSAARKFRFGIWKWCFQISSSGSLCPESRDQVDVFKNYPLPESPEIFSSCFTKVWGPGPLINLPRCLFLGQNAIHAIIAGRLHLLMLRRYRGLRPTVASMLP